MEVIKTQKIVNTGIVVSIIKDDQPIYGGFYSVIATNYGYEVAKKDGLCLDAANECFVHSCNFAILNTYHNEVNFKN